MVPQKRLVINWASAVLLLSFLESVSSDLLSKECCGLDKSKINPATHSACQPAASGDYVEDLPVDIDKTMKEHKECRDMVYPKAKSMEPLSWDDTLACIAQKYARMCPEDHESYDNRAYAAKFPIGVGENIGLGWGAVSMPGIASAWCNEQSNWAYGSGAIVNDTKNQPIYHFTQMVWSTTNSVGCGAAKCKSHDGKSVFVCNYGPAGNLVIGNVDPALAPYPV